VLQRITLLSVTPRPFLPSREPPARAKRKAGAKQKEPPRKRKAAQPGSEVEDLLVAMAMSRSLQEDAAAPSSTNVPARGPPVPARRGRKKQKGGPAPLLLAEAPEAALQRLQRRVSLLLSEEPEVCSTIHLPPSRFWEEEGQRAAWSCPPRDRESAALWESSNMKESRDPLSYYTQELNPPITPWRPPQKVLSSRPRAAPRTPSLAGEAAPCEESGSEEGQLFSRSQRDRQALLDLAELAGEGTTLTQWNLGASDSMEATGRESVGSIAPSGFVPLPEEEISMERDHTQPSARLATLAADFREMVNNPHLSDAQLQTDCGEVLSAHMCVLYARCPLLVEAVHTEGFWVNESSTGRVQRLLLNDVSAEAAVSFLRFLYSAGTDIHARCLPHVSELARRFGVGSLIEACNLLVCEPPSCVSQDPGEKEDDDGGERAETFQELLKSMWVDEDIEALAEPEAGGEEGERVGEGELEEIYEFAATQRKATEEGEEQDTKGGASSDLDSGNQGVESEDSPAGARTHPAGVSTEHGALPVTGTCTQDPTAWHTQSFVTITSTLETSPVHPAFGTLKSSSAAAFTPVASPGRPTLVLSPGRPTLVPSPGRPTLVPSPCRTTLVPSPSRSTLVPSPGRPTLVPSPSRPTLVPSPGRTTLVPSPGHPTLVPFPGRPTLVSSPGRPTLVSSPDRPTILPSPGRPTLLPPPGRPTIVPSPGRPTLVPSPGRPTLVPSPGRRTLIPSPACSSLRPSPARVLFADTSAPVPQSSSLTPLEKCPTPLLPSRFSAPLSASGEEDLFSQHSTPPMDDSFERMFSDTCGEYWEPSGVSNTGSHATPRQLPAQADILTSPPSHTPVPSLPKLGSSPNSPLHTQQPMASPQFSPCMMEVQGEAALENSLICLNDSVDSPHPPPIQGSSCRSSSSPHARSCLAAMQEPEIILLLSSDEETEPRAQTSARPGTGQENRAGIVGGIKASPASYIERGSSGGNSHLEMSNSSMEASWLVPATPLPPSMVPHVSVLQAPGLPQPTNPSSYSFQAVSPTQVYSALSPPLPTPDEPLHPQLSLDTPGPAQLSKVPSSGGSKISRGSSSLPASPADSSVFEVVDSDDEGTPAAAQPDTSGHSLQMDYEPPIPMDDELWFNGEGTPTGPYRSPVAHTPSPRKGSAGKGSEIQGSSTPVTGSPDPASKEVSPHIAASQSSRLSFLNPQLWDEWEEEEELPTVLPLSQRLNMAPSKQGELKTPVTIVRRRERPPVVPITPLPSYSDMDTPVLKKELNRFGVRPLPKKQMVLKLKEIFRYTHQTLSSDSEDEVPSRCTAQARRPPVAGKHRAPAADRAPARFQAQGGRKPAPVSATGIPTRDTDAGSEQPVTASQESTSSSAGGSDTSSLSQSSVTNEFETAFADDDEEDQVPASQAAGREADTAEAVRRFIEGHPELHRRILLYQPLELVALQAELKQSGIKMAAGKLLDFLDAHCITFTTAGARKEKQSRGRRKGGKRR
ncbi:structure-specific endonuclease subunit SLX4, partial [Ascaphus truei]|uniref:structure-specific endonuclease subunit SLX4 n=1 Tax=Ascaphus truei TaxID=8439 RepID=UPI003F59C9CC